MGEKRHTKQYGFGRLGAKVSRRRGRRFSAGFTLVELMITAMIAVIVIFAIGTAIANGMRGWHIMYDRVNADVVANSFVARRTFDRIIRKASRQKLLVDAEGDWIEVYYFSSGIATKLDRYARFYVSDNELKVEHGSWDPGSNIPKIPLRTEVVCSNVSSCVFKVDGRSAQMILALDDGSQAVTVVSSAVMHNRE